MPSKSAHGEHYHSPLATNLRTLAAQRYEGSVNALAKHIGINQSTLNRYCNGTSDITMAKISQIADATGYAAWQLLHPEFDTRRMPPAMDAKTMRVAAIFANITRPVDRRRAEAIMEQFSAD